MIDPLTLHAEQANFIHNEISKLHDAEHEAHRLRDEKLRADAQMADADDDLCSEDGEPFSGLTEDGQGYV